MNVSTIKAQLTQCRDPHAVRAVLDHARSCLDRLVDHQLLAAIDAAWERARAWPLDSTVYRWSDPEERKPDTILRGTAARVVDIDSTRHLVKLVIGGRTLWFQPHTLHAYDWRPDPPNGPPELELKP